MKKLLAAVLLLVNMLVPVLKAEVFTKTNSLRLAPIANQLEHFYGLSNSLLVGLDGQNIHTFSPKTGQVVGVLRYIDFIPRLLQIKNKFVGFSLQNEIILVLNVKKSNSFAGFYLLRFDKGLSFLSLHFEASREVLSETTLPNGDLILLIKSNQTTAQLFRLDNNFTLQPTGSEVLVKKGQKLALLHSSKGEILIVRSTESEGNPSRFFANQGRSNSFISEYLFNNRFKKAVPYHGGFLVSESIQKEYVLSKYPPPNFFLVPLSQSESLIEIRQKELTNSDTLINSDGHEHIEIIRRETDAIYLIQLQLRAVYLSASQRHSLINSQKSSNPGQSDCGTYIPPPIQLPESGHPVLDAAIIGWQAHKWAKTGKQSYGLDCNK